MEVWQQAEKTYRNGDETAKTDSIETLYSLNVDKNILEKATQFKAEGYKNFERVKVLDITDRIKQEVKKLIGFDATGYEIYSNTDTYKHIERRHGENGIQDHSMKDMRDVALMTYVLKRFDTAEIVMNNEGKEDVTYAYSDVHGKPAKMIKFSKEINGVQYVVVAVPENKYKKLWVMSEYKEQKNEDTSQPSHGNKTLPPTPEAHSDNVSSKDIIPQNSENATKKYSIDIDDSLFDALQETYSAQEQETASIIQEGFASLKKVTVDEKVMHRIAYDIKKAYKSNYSIEKLEENLTRVFAYLKDHADRVGYEDMVRIVQEIAKPVIQESTDIDSFEKEIYDNFRNHLRSYTIRLSEEQKAEVAYYYGSYENFRKKNFGNLNISDKGTYLDNIWSEICDHSYEMLDRSVSTADEPIALIDTLNALRPVKKNIYGMDTEQASYDLALDIYRRFFVEQGETRANQKIYEKTQRLIVRQQEYRKRVKGEYDASLQRLREVEQQKRKNLAEKYEQKIADLKEDQKAMLAYKDVKAHNAAQRQMDWYTAALAKTNQKANDRILEIRASNRQSMINKRRNEEIRQCRERIKKNAQGIVNMFNTNTDKKHVPEVLKEPVARFITSIDFVSERANPDSTATLSWQDALNQMYRKLSDRKSAVDGGYIELYDALHDWENGDKKTSTILSDMAAFIDSNSGVKVSEMNIEQLKQLDEMITGLKRTIASVNQLYVNKRTKNVQELANGTIGDLSDKKSKKSRSKIGEMAENLLDVDMLDARSYFCRLGDNAYSIYEELRTAFSDRVWLLKEAQTYMEKTLDGISVKDWTGNKAKVR